MQACFHCGLPVPAQAAFGFDTGGEWRAFCCAGCEAVSRAISGLGLEDYYRLRQSPAPRPAEEAVPDLAAYDAPAVQARFVTFHSDGLSEARLLMEGLRCAACAWLVEQVVRRVPGVAGVEVNYATRRAFVRWDASHARLSAVLEAIRNLGYAAWPFEEGRLEQVEARERRGLMRRLWIAGLGMMQVMMYAVPGYVAGDGEITADAESLMRWAGLVLTLPVLLYSAAPFFGGAWRDLRLRRLGMDVPVALGLAAAFAASVYATVAGRGEAYFDSVTMFVFLLLGGRYLEMVARSRAGDALQHLARVVPQGVSLQPGDVVVVTAGESVPADGVIDRGEASVSEAWLTGESRVLVRRPGDMILAGSVNAGNAFQLRVTRVGADTALSGIHRLMERALADRPRWVQAAERASSFFVASVVAAAIVAGIAWAFIDPARAVWIAVSVLIVTCPCAFALATPAALTVATGRLARGNVAITRARAMEALATADEFVFDKTGTLTHGEPRLLETLPLGALDTGESLRLAAALSRWSSHPLDRALVRAARDRNGPAAERHETFAGCGIEAVVEGRCVRLGRVGFVAELHGRFAPDTVDTNDTTVWLGDERGWIAAFRLGDALRPEAKSAVEALGALGIRVHLLSGDEARVASHVAAELGIGKVTARALPEAKRDYVRKLQEAGHRVAMVGDGINDAPVLAQADVSIAMGGGADLAQLRADAVLLSDDLGDLVEAVKVARRTRRVVRQNVAWALAYNAVAIPLAFAGWVTPLIAGIGMSASSLAVVANALRLRR